MQTIRAATERGTQLSVESERKGREQALACDWGNSREALTWARPCFSKLLTGRDNARSTGSGFAVFFAILASCTIPCLRFLALELTTIPDALSREDRGARLNILELRSSAIPPQQSRIISPVPFRTIPFPPCADRVVITHNPLLSPGQLSPTMSSSFPKLSLLIMVESSL